MQQDHQIKWTIELYTLHRRREIPFTCLQSSSIPIRILETVTPGSSKRKCFLISSVCTTPCVCAGQPGDPIVSFPFWPDLRFFLVASLNWSGGWPRPWPAILVGHTGRCVPHSLEKRSVFGQPRLEELYSEFLPHWVKVAGHSGSRPRISSHAPAEACDCVHF